MSLSSEHKHAAAVEIALLQTVLYKQMDQVSVTNATILMKIYQNCPYAMFAVKLWIFLASMNQTRRKTHLQRFRSVIPSSHVFNIVMSRHPHHGEYTRGYSAIVPRKIFF